MFYTGALHPVYEEIPTPAREGEYQLLNSEYSTLPFSDTYSILPENMVSLLPPSSHKPGHGRQVLVQRGKVPGGGAPTSVRTAYKPVRPGGGGMRGGGIKTLDTRLGPPPPMAGTTGGTSCDSLTYQTPQCAGCNNQNDFLPREAWTDFSGSHAWISEAGKERPRKLAAREHVAPADGLRYPKAVSSRSRIGVPAAACSPDRRRISCESREISPTCNSLESSDVTISTSSSETYPKAAFGGETFGKPPPAQPAIRDSM